VPEKDWQNDVRLGLRRQRKARAVLGLPETAGVAEVRRAFRRGSLATHPDAHPGDPEARRRFHLICAAYKCLTEGELCAAMDELEAPPAAPGGDRYRLDNPWGYWCWWRDKYFDAGAPDAPAAGAGADRKDRDGPVRL